MKPRRKSVAGPHYPDDTRSSQRHEPERRAREIERYEKGFESRGRGRSDWRGDPLVPERESSFRREPPDEDWRDQRDRDRDRGLAYGRGNRRRWQADNEHEEEYRSARDRPQRMGAARDERGYPRDDEPQRRERDRFRERDEPFEYAQRSRHHDDEREWRRRRDDEDDRERRAHEEEERAYRHEGHARRERPLRGRTSEGRYVEDDEYPIEGNGRFKAH